MGKQKIQLEINICLEDIKHGLKILCNAQCPYINGIKCAYKSFCILHGLDHIVLF